MKTRINATATFLPILRRSANSHTLQSFRPPPIGIAAVSLGSRYHSKPSSNVLSLSFTLNFHSKLKQQCRFISTSTTPPNTGDSLPTSIPNIPQQPIPTEVADLPPILNSYGDPILEIHGLISFLEVTLNNLHTLTGLPWWALIGSFSILVRVVFVPLYYQARKNVVEWQSAQPDLAPFYAIREKAAELGFTKDMRKAEEGIGIFRKRWNDTGMFKHLWKRFAPLPLILLLSLAIRDMANITPSFQDGGLPFCPDLSLSVLTIGNYAAYSLPFISVIPALLYNEYRWYQTKKSLPPGEPVPKLLKYITYALRVIYIGTVPLTMYMPVGIFFAWIPGNLFTTLITMLLETRLFTVRVLDDIRDDMKKNGVELFDEGKSVN
eukprot:TRINITY_DN1075_c0_g3_i3.p1 TRINITY_DN1075_c0_g3~~TRINITY_DN1075_c0_g3_i3.p1  ORF type:complete len:379 (-),score=70.98 TRINITY_DN1075_c0_g3_i3:54-1190(-)